MRRRNRRLAIAGVLVLAAAGGGVGGWIIAGGGDDDGPTPSRVAADRECERAYVTVLPSTDADKPPVILREVAELDQPTTLAFAPGSDVGVIGEREGRVLLVVGNEVTDRLVLDFQGVTQTEGDGGLLGLAYDPDGDWLYAYRTTGGNDERIIAVPVVDGVPSADGLVRILDIEHPPSQQHHGGGFAFGPDGFLYIGTGDGGGLGDPLGNAQNGEVLLGKILRIDPTPEGPEPYRVPPDNPFVDRDGWRPEIWALGVRNPFRLTFDAATDDLWLGDVGHSCWEEIDLLPATTGAGRGANLGWDLREGTHPFEGGEVPGLSTEPVHTYAHSDGWCAIVVGPVVGDALPELDGWLLHSDYCKGRLMALDPDGSLSGGLALLDLGLRVDRPVAIVAGPDGVPWVLSLDGSVSRLVRR